MSDIKDNINNELENVSFDVSVDILRKKANIQKAKRNTLITTIICAFAVSVILCCGVVSGKNKIIQTNPTTQTTILAEKSNIKNSFTISACAIEVDTIQDIEKGIATSENAELTENATVTVMEHKITIEDMIRNGRTYHMFSVGKSVEEQVDERLSIVYTTEPIIYVKGDNIKMVDFTADIVTLDNTRTANVNYFLEKATSDQTEKISTPIYYTVVPLPKKFDDLCIKCNETDYEFNFSDIPIVNITVKITFENGELQEKQVQAYYNDEGYFTIKS